MELVFKIVCACIPLVFHAALFTEHYIYIYVALEQCTRDHFWVFFAVAQMNYMSLLVRRSEHQVQGSQRFLDKEFQ